MFPLALALLAVTSAHAADPVFELNARFEPAGPAMVAIYGTTTLSRRILSAERMADSQLGRAYFLMANLDLATKYLETARRISTRLIFRIRSYCSAVEILRLI